MNNYAPQMIVETPSLWHALVTQISTVPTPTDANICFQLMATENPDLFNAWTTHWDDLTDFTIYPITEKPT